MEATDPQARTVETGGARAAERAAVPSVRELIDKILRDPQNMIEPAQAKEAQQTRGSEVSQRMARTAADLKILVDQVKKAGVQSADVKFLPRLTQRVLTQLQQNQISPDSSPVLVALLRRSLDPSTSVDDRAGLIEMVREVDRYKEVDPQVARAILSQAKDRLENEFGYTSDNEDIQRINRTLFPKTQLSVAEMAIDRDKYSQNAQAAQNSIQNLPVNTEAIRNNLQQTYGKMYEEAVKANNLSAGDASKMLEELVNKEVSDIRSGVMGMFSAVAQDVGDPQQREITLGQFEQRLSELVGRGLISEPTKTGLMRRAETMRQMLDKRDAAVGESGLTREGLGGSMAQAGIRLSEKQSRVLGALESPHKLEELLRSNPQYTDPLNPGKLNWKEFYQDVKDIFDEILSVADSRPKDFFDQAFNPMYEGHFYNILLKQLKQLGHQIEELGSEFLRQSVELESPVFDTNPMQRDPNLPKDKLVYTKKTSVSLSEAIGTRMHERMLRLKQVKEYLHNIDAIADQGMGWEQLSKYSEQLTIDKIDWYYHDDADLSQGYNLYVASLMDEIAANADVIQTEFGFRDDQGLNAWERRAYYQMYSYLKEKYPQLDETQLKSRAKQKIRAAAAVTIGVTGEFWNIVMTARMPVGYEKKSIMENGKKRDYLEVGGRFVGTGMTGYEKMIAQLDLGLLLERFGLPKYFNNFRFVYRPRDLRNPGSAYDYHHGDVYKWGAEHQDAFFKGYTDELYDFDQKNVFFMDYMRTNCVGLFARGGWRFTEWKSLIQPVTNSEGTVDFGEVDFEKTLFNMRKAGSFIVKQFLDGVPIKQLDAKGVEMLLGIKGKRGKDLSDDEVKKYDKKAAYRKYLFGFIHDTAATKYLRMESRRYTPAGETTLREDLLAYLRNTYKGKYEVGTIEHHMYKMYLSALTLAEKKTWQMRKETTQSYIFSNGDIDACRAELVDFYEMYRTNEVGAYMVGGKRVAIDEDFETFFKNLKDFNTTLRTSIDKKRWTKSDRRQEITLEQRFTDMALKGDWSSMNDLQLLLAGDDFDLGNFYFQAGGGRPTGRMMHETFVVASKMNPALSSLFNEAIPEFVKGQYPDLHKLEEAMAKLFVKPFKEIHGAIAGMDKDQADGYVVSLAAFVGRLIGKDRIMRVKGIGPVINYWMKNMYKTTQSSLMQDFYRDNMGRPAKALDSDELFAFGHIILNACNVSQNEEKPHYYEDVKVMGVKTGLKKRVNMGEHWENTKLLGFIPWKKKTVGHGTGHVWTIEEYEKTMGLTGISKVLETWAPALTIAFIIALLAIMKMAESKNKKR